MAIAKTLKYPLFLFIVLLIAKIGYVVVESFYNYHVLFTTTSIDNITKETIEQLNKNGHLISSAGITFLLIPFMYFIIKRVSNTTVMYLTLIVLSTATFFTSYTLLNKAVDYIVEVNQDKRHDAYYINLFKFGLLKNHFEYNSFIDSNNIKNNNLSINDRILLTNSFLLLNADEKLIDKLKKRGYERAPEIYIDKNIEQFNVEFNKFQKLATEIDITFDKFNNAKEKLQTNVNKINKLINNKKEIDKHFNELNKQLESNYNQYKKDFKKYQQAKLKVEKRIKEETSYSKISDTYKKLNYYFENKGSSRVQKKYDSIMIEKFGKKINPKRWLDRYDNLTMYQIKKVITEVTSAKLPEIGPVNRQMSFNEFKNLKKVKKEISKKLKNKGVLITENSLNYTKTQLTIAYNNMLIKKKKKLYRTFRNQLNKKLGKHDLTTKTTRTAFLRSAYLKRSIKKKMPTLKNRDINKIIKVLKSKNRRESFKKEIYIPKIKPKIDKIFFTKAQFEKDQLAIDIGNDAIKLLYIPPFALAISILALLLNFVTVIGLLLEGTRKVPTFMVWFIKIGVVATICMLPIIQKYDGLNNELLRKEANLEVNNYLDFLNWLSYYERLNINIHE